MKISLNWLKDFIDLSVEADDLPQHLLKLGFEVDETIHQGPDFTGVVVGEVLTVAPHPNADRLRLCQVSDGTETLSVVCGAPNVAEGQKIAFAKIGAKLPGDFKIKKSKIRGEVSHGMICSATELQLAQNGKKEDGILVLPENAQVGADFGASMGEPDVILDVDITPNRPDCLSHLGLARELAVHFHLPLKNTAAEAPGIPDRGPAAPKIENQTPEDCPRYRGQTFENAVVGPSPKWLTERLSAIGLRPINNAVDITNYVLHETGQPLHVFDADKLDGGKIVIRNAKAGEKLLALDGKEYALGPEDLVIADGKKPVALAGVIGGEETSVTAATKRIILECAHFRPGKVRAGAKRHGIRTDSSYRFERGTDDGAVAKHAERAAGLLRELCGAVSGAPEDTNPAPKPPESVEVTAERINKILGADYPEERIEAVLKALSADTRSSGKTLTLYPPSYRRDLETPWDLAEEAARHLGYGAVPAEAGPVRLPAPEKSPAGEEAETLRNRLIGLGFLEAYNYDFLSAEEITTHYEADREKADASYPKLLNPISEDWQYLRADLLPGLLRNARTNFNRGAEGFQLFEMGHAYAKGRAGVEESVRVAGIIAGNNPSAPHWDQPQRPADFFAAKGVIETALAGAGVELRPICAPDGVYHPKAAMDIVYHDKVIGRFGLLHPERLAAWDLSQRDVAVFEWNAGALAKPSSHTEKLDAKTVEKALHAAAKQPGAEKRGFRRYSVYPSSKRDLSVLVDTSAAYAEIETAVFGAKVPEVVRCDLIDVFTGKGVPEGKKSLTIRITFSRTDRTPKDEETQAGVDKILQALQARCGARLRA